MSAIDPFLNHMAEQDASDLFLKEGSKAFLRISGKLIPVGEEALTREELVEFTSELLGPDRRQLFHADRELNFAFDRAGIVAGRCGTRGRLRARRF